jgi:hypothetical protein
VKKSPVDPATGRKFYLDYPDDITDGEPLTFLLNLHGGGSFGAWQRLYFPAHDHVTASRLVVATPTAATAEPMRRWVAEADDEHLRNVTEYVFARFGLQNIAAFWLTGHSQGGLTANRLATGGYFAQRIDGYASLSGGRLGPAGHVDGFGPPPQPGEPLRRRIRFSPPALPDADMSFIFAVGEHEITGLPETSPLADRLGAGPRVRLPDVIDAEPGQVYDRYREGRSAPSWGLLPRPGVAQVYQYPDADQARVIADIVRLDKGHTEGLEPNVTGELVRLITSAPGGKARSAG